MTKLVFLEQGKVKLGSNSLSTGFVKTKVRVINFLVTLLSFQLYLWITDKKIKFCFDERVYETCLSLLI